MKMRQCVCLYHMYMGFVREEGKELRNMKMQMHKQIEN